MDTWRFIELISVSLFGFAGYIATIYSLTNNNFRDTFIFCILFIVIVAVSTMAYILIKDRKKEKSKEDNE